LQQLKRVAQILAAAAVDRHPIEDSCGSAELLRRHHCFDIATAAANVA